MAVLFSCVDILGTIGPSTVYVVIVKNVVASQQKEEDKNLHKLVCKTIFSLDEIPSLTKTVKFLLLKYVVEH